ncbi:unnamed protein product [Effrenium voratum]|nr:unnamed protein product [Effrenium voratum]
MARWKLRRWAAAILPLSWAFLGFKVVPLEGKGMGVIAEKTFQPGDLVYEEAPLLVWNSEEAAQAQLKNVALAASLGVAALLLAVSGAYVWALLPLAGAGLLRWRQGELQVPEELQEQWQQLSPEQRSKLRDLSDCTAGDKTIMGILQTNGFSRGASESSDGLLVCPTLARLNHSCSPNCQQSWDEQSGTEKLYAMSEIPAGQEMCITYCDLRAPREARRQVLQAKYGFLCTCPACEDAAGADPAGADASAASDARRIEIRRLMEQGGKHSAEEVLRLMDEEGLADLTLRGLACLDAAAELRRADPVAAARWARKAYVCFSRSRGPDSDLARGAKDAS